MTEQPRTGGNHQCGVHVGVSGITTTCTKELRLSLSVRLINTTASRAGATCVPWVYGNHEDTSKFSLVLDKGSQLRKRPGVDNPPLTLPNRYPLGDTLDVFKCNPTVGAFGQSHQLLTNAVINVSLEAPFFAAPLLQFPLGRLGAFGLKFGAKARVASADTVDVVSCEDSTIGCSSDVGDTEVYTKKPYRQLNGGFGNVTRLIDVEYPISVHKVCFALHALKQPKGMLPRNEGDTQSAIHCPNGNRAVLQVPRENATVIGDAAMLSEDADCPSILLVGIGNLSDDTHCELGGKTKLLASICIAEMVQIVLPKALGLPCAATHMVSSSIGSLKSASQEILFGFSCLEFGLSNQFHLQDYYTTKQQMPQEKGRALPLPPKGGQFPCAKDL